MRYLVKNEAGEIVNVIVWDGATDYEPGEGLTLEEAPSPPEPETPDA